MQEGDEQGSSETEVCDKSSAMPCMERNPWINSTLTQVQQDEMEESNEVDSSTQGMLAADDNFTSGCFEESSIFEGPLPNPAGHFPSPVHGGVFDPIVIKPVSKDVIDRKNAEQGVCGLKNLGNTCFMNSGLQCLLCNPRIVKHILEEFGERNSKLVESSLTGHFAQLLKKVWSGQYTVLHPSSFKETLGYYHSQFEDFRQHDCQEFLALLLDSLHEQLNHPKQNVGQNSVTAHLSDQLSAMEGCSTSQSDARGLPSTVTVETLKSSPEDSNESAASLQSAEFIQSDSFVHRAAAVPLHVGPFSDPSNKILQNNKTEVNSEESPNNAPESQKTETAPENSEGERKLPTIEDLYMKDTKTLNTNVLAAEFEQGEVATDSEKYHKQDNTNPLEDPMESFSSLHGMNAGAIGNLVEKGEPFKPLKETNLLANHREKFAEEGCSKKMLFSEIMEDQGDCDINNIKRIKIDEQIVDKNYRMQKLLKINTDRNPLHDVMDCGYDVIKSKSAETSDKMNNVACVSSSATVSSCDAQIMNNARPKTQLSPRAGCSGNFVPQGAIGMDMDTSLGTPMGFNNEQHMMAKYIQEADKEWAKYLQRNRSVIVDTFQGQFKSTVVCSECYHMSVTFEPFMYLSVPIPHAMDKQISVIFVPCDSKQPVRYLVTLHKHGKVQQMKYELRKLIGEESCDLIVAEVFDKHISRVLDDNMMLRYVNDYYRTIYAFEMLPPPSLDEINTQNNDVSSSMTSQGADQQNDVTMLPNNIVTSSSNCTMSQLDLQSSGSVTSTSHNQEILNNSVSSSGSYHANLEFRTDVDWQTNLLNEADSTSKLDGNMESSLSDVDMMSHSMGGDSNMIDSSEAAMIGPQNKPDSGGSEKVLDSWKSCAICLEEMDDKELMIHASCGGTLCHTCLDMTFKHYGDNAFVCPVCSTQVNPGEEFVQVNCMSDYKPKTRILSVPVLQRHVCIDQDGLPEVALFGHPNLMYIASQVTGEVLYNSVDRVAPVLAHYNVVLTDAQGKRCSRCLYTDHCSGCPLSRDQECISLLPGDHLMLHYSGLDLEQRDNAGRFVDHKSMQDKRSDEPLSLFDCFKAFTESETLDEHNPWYCPRCRKNQCARKTITVWKYPQTLVVYLKRFVFHELVGTKIDNKVVFPLENLDLSGYISGPKTAQLKYDLQSFVCHFGGTTSGHYTAYSKHPLSDQWYHYNDEITKEEMPIEEDYGNAYVLFYQQQGEKLEIKFPSSKGNSSEFDIEPELEEKNSLEFEMSKPSGPAPGPVNANTVSMILEGLREQQENEESHDHCVVSRDTVSRGHDLVQDEPDSTSEQLDFYS